MKYITLLVFISSLLFIGFVPGQKDFFLMLPGFAAAFTSYLLLIRKTHFKTRNLIFVALGIRIAFIFTFPNLSDDIYRFIWDGNLLHIGESPFQFLPSEYLDKTTNPTFREIYPLLNSQNYYSVYPPFAQFIFYLSTFSWMNSAIIIKVLLLLAECITLYFGIKLLDILKLNVRNILWYALNPLIIIEVMVNIHFEGFMVSFFTLFLYFLHRKRLNQAAVNIALAVSAKLVPLLFMPYFLFQWAFKKSATFYLKIGASLLVIFSPLLFHLGGFGQSLDLYFRKFEFNASIYFLLRAFGNAWKGYNMIASIGPFMALVVFGGVMVLAFKMKNFIEFSIWSLLTFLLLSTTIHPWYLALGVLLSVFSQRKFFVVWSFLVVLSYSFYSLEIHQYYAFIVMEYGLLAVYLIFENRSLRLAKA